MHRYLLIIYFLTVSITSFSQKVELKIDSLINLEIKKHIQNNVSEIGYTKCACINYGIRTNAYLFWSDDNNTYIQKFIDSEYNTTEFKKFQPFEIIDSVFFHFYKRNSEDLLSEEVIPFNYKLDSVVGNMKYCDYTTISHSCHRNFKIFLSDTTFEKHFDFFDLREFDREKIDNSTLSKELIEKREKQGWEVDTTYENTPTRNIHYEFNKGLRIVEWNILLTEFIEKLESEKKFSEIESE